MIYPRSSALICGLYAFFSSLLVVGKTAQTEYFPERDVQVHYSQAANGATHIHIVEIRTPGAHEISEVIPIVRPRENQQEEPDVQTQRNEQHRRCRSEE